ncbi:MAG: VWA domain-containing protein [Armatimonadota bacterium]|nr:VWA domain-containing protein [Armatimonadota bacterium]MDR7452225.1 VWA domain-containing protein [Armatimonadota bacterium]MDR7466680.1 VWA domain-containing protein [Armatimonadota bacterium]MDR7492846.1 VWA domain-containing protein [Armatimonadota bacterium]MDR7498622.1 VWA domain-containing protein [Armatimonadota bacterium]
MEFGWPVMLWALAAPPLLLWGYVRLVRRAARRERLLADPHLLSVLWSRPPALRRHLPVAFYLAAATILTLAVARPIAAIPLPVNRAALIIALDISKSMIGEDVAPNRLKAAQDAALDLLEAMPPTAKVGLVVFSDYAQVLVPPTTERETIRQAIGGLKVQQATGMGSAIVESLRVLPGRRALLGDRLNVQPGGPPGLVPSPPAGPVPDQQPADLPPAAIVIFSDGVSNLGIPPNVAISLAVDGKVKVYGVGVGTPNGSVMTVDNQLVLVPFDATLLSQVSQATGGRYFEITQREELRRIYRQLGRAMGWERRRTEVTSFLAGAAGILMMVGALFSMIWFRRVP